MIQTELFVTHFAQNFANGPISPIGGAQMSCFDYLTVSAGRNCEENHNQADQGQPPEGGPWLIGTVGYQNCGLSELGLIDLHSFSTSLLNIALKRVDQLIKNSLQQP